MTENLFEQGLDNFDVPENLEETPGLELGNLEQPESPEQSPLGTPTSAPVQSTPQVDPPAKKYKSYEAALDAAELSAKKYFPFADASFARSKTVSGDRARKYNDMDYGYRYGVDMDDFYGEMESPLTTFTKGVGRFALGVGTKVGQGAGFILGLANPQNWDEDIITKASDNGITYLFDQLDEKTKQDWLPTFQEAADRDKGFWNKFFTDGDFWMTDAVDGAAFLVSAWVPGMALSKLGLGTKLAQSLSGLRLGVGGAEAAVEGAAMTQNYLTKANSIFKTGIDKFNAWALATSSEAMFEAAEARRGIIDSLTYDEFGRLKINPVTGTPYSEDEKRKIAGGAAQNSFLLNAALLAGTNALELRWIGSMFGAGERAAVSGITGATNLTDRMVAEQAVGKFSKFLSSGKGAFLSGATQGILAEGFVEENAQLAIQRVNQQYGMQGKIAEFGNLGDFITQFKNQTFNALIGKDPEAATSIGIGGILGTLGGGISSTLQQRKDRTLTEQVINAYNLAQDNWLKFGNIYKTQDVFTVDEQGATVKTQQVVFDQNGEPVVDQEKLSGALTGYTAVTAALDEASKLQPGFQRDILRDTAFADFVTAHINAGIENTVIDKLNSLQKASPQDLAKLGFTVGENAEQQINRYKNLASAIINQNKLINSDILVDNSQEDKARKNYLLKLAADQAVYKSLVNENQTALTEIQNQLVTSENSSLSDGLVDQLNELAQRIKSQEEILQEMGTSPDTGIRKQVANQVLDELKQNYEQLEKDNTTTIQSLKKDKDGFYQYEKPGRNIPGVYDQYKKKVRLKGELQNQIKLNGLEWAKYADAKNGKQNFLQMFKEDIVDPLTQAAAEAQDAQSQPGKTITLTGTDAKGNPKAIDITVGKLYVGKFTKSERYRGKQIVSVFNNDKIKILDISEDGSTVTIKTNGEVMEMSAQELADIAIPENWRAFDSLTDDQKLYLTLRNQVIEYRVLERDASGKAIKQANGKYKTRVVKGRVAMNKNRTDLLFTYIDPTTNKKKFVDFDMRYVVNQESLEKLLTPQQFSVKSQEEKVKQKYETQKQFLTNLITETEAKLADADTRRQANVQEFQKLEEDLKGMREMLQEAVSFLEKNPYTRGRKSNAYKSMEELSQQLTDEINKKETQLAALQKEKEDLTNLLEALKSTNELYYQGLIELEETTQPFLADQSGSIYAQEQADLETAQDNQVTRRFNSSELEQMIEQTEAEVELIDDRVNYLQGYINQLRKMLDKVLVFKDVADALMDITDREQLRNALKMLEDQSSVLADNTDVTKVGDILLPSAPVENIAPQVTDVIKKEIVKALRKGLARGDKGIEAQYTLELIQRLKDSVQEMDDLIQKRDELAPKLIRLETALQQKQLVTSLQERVNFLKTIQEGLLAQYEIRQQEILTQRQSKTAEVVQNQMMGDKLADEEVSQDSETYNFDVKKPLLAVHGLFTTAGRHFVDDADTELNIENNNALFYKLSAMADLLTDEFYLMPVTADNDTFGIRRPDVYGDDIKLVVVKKVGNEFKFVDANGEVLENPTKETLVYTSMHGNATMFGENVQAAVDSVKNSFTTKGLTDAEILDHIKRFKAFRDKIKADIEAGRPAYVPVMGKSKGVQVFVEKDASGLPQELPMEGRLISEDTADYTNMTHPDGQGISLVVSTLKDNTAVDVKPGRVIMQKADGTGFRVFNRQLSQEEKDNFINTLKVLTGLLARKNSTTSPLSKQEALDLSDVLTYLNGLVFWTKQDSISQSENKFYINQDNGMLYRGTNAVALTADAIEAAKETLTKDLYHQVNNNLVKLNDPFFQVIVDENMKISKVEYQNYVHYLLGTQDMKGQDRKLGTPVVYTNTPTYSPDDLTPQLKSVFFTYQDPDNPIIPKVTVTQNNIAFPAAQAQPNGQPVVGTAATGFVINPAAFGATAPAASQQQTPAPAVAAQNPFIFNPAGFTAQPQAQPAAQPQPAVPGFVFNPNQPVQAQSTTQAPANPFIINTAEFVAPPQPVFPTTQTATPGASTLISTILSDQYQQSMPSMSDPSTKVSNVYREALDTLKKREDFKKVAKWFSEKLPQISVEKIAGLIDGIAWGAFKNGAVYISENAEEGTGFHEAFEAVWGSYLTVEEQMELAKAFRSLEGEFTNPFTKETKPYSQASIYDVREMLAEGMRDYMLERSTYGGKILAFFKELWNAIKALVGLGNINEAEELINNVYKSINQGKYVNAKQVRDVSMMGTAYSQAIPGTTQEFSTQFTEGLTGFFFMNLYASQKNIDSLLDKYSNTNQLLKQLFVQSLEDMKSYLVGPMSNFAQRYVNVARKQLGRDLTQDELNFLYTQYLNQDRNAYQIEQAFGQPKYVYDNLKASLKKFGLQFKELTSQEDEEFINNKEESVTDALGIRDAIFIDPRRLTAVNFRMLLGSLTSDTYDSAYKSDTNPMGIVFEKNNLGLPKLIDFDNVHNMLINELNGSASRIEGGKFIDALTEMMNKLDKKYKNINGTYKPGYVWIQRLKNRLKYAGTEGSYFTTANVTADDIALMIGFEKSLLNKQNLPVKTIIGENGYIFDTDPIQTNSESKIREEWENNVMTSTQPLSRKSQSNLLGVDDKGMIVIDRSSYAYAGNPVDTSKPHLSMSRPTFNQIIEILSEFGIKFTASNEELKKHKVAINRSYSAIREKIIDGTISTMQDLYGRNVVNKAITDLVEIQAEYSAEDNVLMHLTAEGKPQYSITLPSNITYVLNSLNDAKNLADFVSSNPQFGFVDQSGNVALHPYQSRSLLLKPGGLIFDADGNKRLDMDVKYHLISGVSAQDSDGTNTSDLTYPDRVMQEIHYLLKNIHYTIINSDKSTEFALGLNNSFVSFREASAGIDSADFSKVINIYMDQLEDEIDSAVREQELPSNIQYYSKEVKQLGHYRDILGPALVKEFTDKVLKKKMTKQDFMNKPAVQAAIKNHITGLASETLQGLIDLDIIKATQVGTTTAGKPVFEYSTKAISQEQLSLLKLDGNQMNQADIESLMTYLAVNKEIAVVEQHKLIYGHPVMYKDLAKRANGANSNKDAIVDNHEIVKWMDQNMPRLDGKKRSSNTTQTFKNVSFKDVNTVSEFYKEIAENMYTSMKEDMSKDAAEKRIGVKFDAKGKFKNFILDDKKGFTGEIKAYLNLNEADAQAYIMPDLYRDMLYLSSKISKNQLRQWEYERAYEVVARSSKRKDHPAYKNYSKIYTKEQMAEFRKIVEAGSPGIVMQPLKPQYFGYANNSSLMQTVFLKHSVQPKFYRQVEGSQFEKLYLAAQNNQVDIVGFESGEKVGNMLNSKGEFLPIYNTAGEINIPVQYDQNGNTQSVNLPAGMPVQELFTRYYGIQQEVPALSKSKVVRGTQVTKLVMSNFKVDGKFTSAEAEAKVNEYNSILRQMIRLGKEELLEELGMQRLGDGSYIVADINKMVSMLREELEKRDLPNNLIDGLQATPDGSSLMYKFDTLANRNKIDNILNSIVDSRVISDKMFGKSAVQVASTGFEGAGRTMVYLNNGVYEEVGENELTDEQRASVQTTSNELKFYRNENGRIQGMEVYVSWFFDGVKPEDVGLKLVNGIYQIPENFDMRLLEAIGFRIPTQGMNSIENIIIKGFLPKEAGDMVVVPSEIVGKAGSDFDIDKLNMYLSNYYVLDGKINYLQDGLTTEQLTEIAKKIYAENTDTRVETNEFINSVFEGIPNDETEFVQSFVKNYEKKNLQNKFKKVMQDLVSLPENYRQLVVPNGAATLKSLASEINELKGKDDAESSFLALRKFIPMAEVRQRYLTGKAMVGIAALQTTSHTMSQVSGIRLTGTYDPKSLYYLFEGTRKKEIIVRLPHNRNENGDLYLYAKKDQSGRWISELLSEALTGFVDAAKDPFVFELNLSLGTAGTWFYLQKLGVPVQDVAYLFNQPIVDQYMKEEAKNRSYFKKANDESLSKFMLMMKVAAPYMDNIPSLRGTYEKINNLLSEIDKFEEADIPFQLKNQQIIGFRKQIKQLRQKTADELSSLRDESKTLRTDDLRGSIERYYSKGYKLNEKDSIFQLGVLLDYLEYNSQAQYLTEFIRSIGYDNTKTKSIIENQLQNTRWEKMLGSEFIANPDAILENTFLGEMKEQKEDLPNLFRNFFVSLHPKAQPVFEPLKRQINNRDIFMLPDAQAELINKYQNFFINYIIQTTPYMKNGIQTSLNGQYENLMKGAMSMGKQLKMLREVPDPNISENLVVKELLPILTSDSTQVDNIKLFKNRMDTFKNNILIESVDNLYSYAKTTGNIALQNFVENLGTFAILQTGLQEGGLNYTKILPVHLYTKVVNEIMTNFTDGVAEVNPQLVWRQFHQNNWRNQNITPRVKFAKKDKLTGNLLLSASYSDSEYDYVSKTTIRPDIAGRANEQRRAELLKQKRYNEVFETVIYEKIQSDLDMGDDTNVAYRPIQKLGDGYKFVEVYATDRSSIIPQNLTVDLTTGALQATYIPQSEVSVVSEASAVKPVLPQNQGMAMPSNLILKLQAPGTQTSSDMGSLQMQPDNIAKIKAGTKTITNRTFRLTNGVYTLPDGTKVDVTYEGQADVEYIGDSVIVTTSDTNKTWSGDEFAKAEGFKNWSDFQQNSQFSKNFIDGKQSRYIHGVSLVTTQSIAVSTTTDQSDAQILASSEYRAWAAANANPIMTDQENLEYYKQCKL